MTLSTLDGDLLMSKCQDYTGSFLFFGTCQFLILFVASAVWHPVPVCRGDFYAEFTYKVEYCEDQNAYGDGVSFAIQSSG